MDEIYDEICELAMKAEDALDCGYGFVPQGYLENTLKRLARLCRKGGDDVYWDKLPFTEVLLRKALDYIFYVYFDEEGG